MRINIQILGLIAVLGWLPVACQSQIPDNRARCTDDKFDRKVASWLRFSVKTVSPNDVKRLQNPLILDAREKNEYDVSHLPNAVFCGYNDFDKAVLNNVPKNQPIVVYCSIGYRSEKIGEKLQKMGFTNVNNLYGSIFEWVNQGNPVVNTQGDTVQKVHTFNQDWSRWVKAPKVEKIW